MTSVCDQSNTTKICRACLSMADNIKYYTIKDYMRYFTDFAKIKMDSLEVHWLCHECNYSIGRILTFTDIVINADFMLKGLIGKTSTGKDMILDYLKAARDVLAVRKLANSRILSTNYINDRIPEGEVILYQVPKTLKEIKEENDEKTDNCDYDVVKIENIQIKNENFDEDDSNFFDDVDDLPLISMRETLKKTSKKRGRPLKLKKRLKFKSDQVKEGSLKKRQKLELIAENNQKVKMITLNKEEQIQALKEQENTKMYIESVYKCEMCMKGFRFEETFKAHLERHNEKYGEYRCDVCTQYMKTAASHRNHMLNHSKRYRCTECDYTRYSRSSVVEHYGAEHLKEIAKMQCNLCGKEFLKPSVMRKHMQYRHGEKDNKPTCKHCGKSFTAQETLRLHMLKHLGPKPEGRKRYKCEACDMSFRTPTLLRSHGTKHSDSRDYYCVECDLSFKSEYILKQHLKASKRHVEPSSLMQCPQCPMKILNQKLLDQHIEKTHLLVADFPCGLCDRAFYTNTLLRKHHRRVHEGIKPPKKHICDICSKGFRTKITLNNHMHTHTGEKPFECKLCEACFGHPGALYTHVKLIHKNIKREIKKKTTAAVPIVTQPVQPAPVLEVVISHNIIKHD